MDMCLRVRMHMWLPYNKVGVLSAPQVRTYIHTYIHTCQEAKILQDAYTIPQQGLLLAYLPYSTLPTYIHMSIDMFMFMLICAPRH
jgi:hypothetical protein